MLDPRRIQGSRLAPRIDPCRLPLPRRHQQWHALRDATFKLERALLAPQALVQSLRLGGKRRRGFAQEAVQVRVQRMLVPPELLLKLPIRLPRCLDKKDNENNAQ